MSRTTHIRTLVIALATAVSLLSGIVPAQASNVSAQAIPRFTMSGSGWGHGIGMSQYGAKGFADLGKSGEWIATYYYPGTTIGTAAARNPNVNLDAAAVYSTTSATYNAGYTRTSWRVRPGYAGGTLVLNDTWTLNDQVWTIAASGTSFTVSAGTTSYGPFTSITLKPSGSPALSQIIDASGPFKHVYVRYRGTLKVTINTTAIRNAKGVVTREPGYLKMINSLPMDDYLFGVVPRESPSSWPQAALVAQALTARSYAYCEMRYSTNELYCTTSSQVYNGHSKGSDRSRTDAHEASSSNAAVSTTTGRYVKYNGAVITTYFCSSSGGHTANIEDVWLTTGEPSSTHPYRRGVPSPYEGDRSWGPLTLDGLSLGAAIKASSPSSCPPGAGSSVWINRIVPDRAASGHVRRLTFYWSNGHVTNGFSGSTFRTAVNARTGQESIKSTVIYFNGFPMTRIEGATRYDTAVQVSRAAFPSTSAPAVVIASGEDFPDALAGSSLAGVEKGALLLTTKAALPESVRLELQRLRPERVYVLGGSAAVSEGVMSSVRAALPSAETTRLAGVDRYQTAARVAEAVARVAEPEAAFVVSGGGWPDAASASAFAYATGSPILLARGASVGADTKAVLGALKPATVYIAGGTKVVGAAVDPEVKGVTGGAVVRLGGADRYDTSRLIAERSVSAGGFVADAVYLATGATYADALTGGVVAGSQRRPLMLTAKDVCPNYTRSFLQAHRSEITKLYLLGGRSAISDKGASSLDSAMMN